MQRHKLALFAVAATICASICLTRFASGLPAGESVPDSVAASLRGGTCNKFKQATCPSAGANCPSGAYQYTALKDGDWNQPPNTVWCGISGSCTRLVGGFCTCVH